MSNEIPIPSLIDNPQLLVPLLTDQDTSKLGNNLSELEAIYIPFKHRIKYVKELLNELSRFKGPIYLLPSDDYNLQSLGKSVIQNAQVLFVEEGPFCEFYTGLLTSNHKHTKDNITWDLPKKRNFILQHALVKGYKRILLVDDDIRSINEKCLVAGAGWLKHFVLAGCFVKDFLDTSLLGHLEFAAGEQVEPFLSGSFLFLRPSEVAGFFPCLYNEDWLFMIPHVMDGSICSFGSICQVEFDPFDDIAKPVFQEFGEIIVEGLFALIASKQYERRREIRVWRDMISQRRKILLSLSHRLPETKHQKVIMTMLDANSKITSDDCCRFVIDWEADLISWTNYIKGFK